MDDKQKDLEADLSYLRILELKQDPIKGNYDVEHLCAINQHIFQDLPKVGFTNYTPGVFRKEVPAGHDWLKERVLQSQQMKSIVAYSRMDKDAIDRLSTVLERAKPELLGSGVSEFSKNISSIYADLDYIHPFPDGNSRTLRFFTQSLANECGYNIDWDKFNNSDAGRDVLYIARDLSVCERALPNIVDKETKRDLLYTVDTFSGNKSLTGILPEVIQPMRAYVFEKAESQELALKLHPELLDAYNAINAVSKYFESKMPNDKIAQNKANEITRRKIQDALNKGEISNFQDKSVDKPTPVKSKSRVKDAGLER